MEELDPEEVQWVTRQNRGWGKAKMLSEFPDHPEVKWEEPEPVINAPTLDVETDSEGEEETCAANTGDNTRNPSVSTIPIHNSEGYESVKRDDLVDALLLETEPDIPQQRGQLDDEAKCLLAFPCMVANKTTHSERRILSGRSPARTVGPSGSTSQGWYHTVRVPFGIDTIQYSGVLYGIA